MLSHLFQYVSNRNNFENPWLNTTVPFTPVKPAKDIQDLRKQLLLDTAEFKSDYYVTAAVAVLLSNTAIAHQFDIQKDIQPEIWKKIQTEQFTVYTPYWFLTNSKEGPASVNRQVNTWPIDINVSVAKLTDTIARVKSGSITEDVVAIFRNDNTLQIEWPVWVGIQGSLKCKTDNNAWKNESVINMKIVPSNYPAAAIINKIKNTPAFLNVLENASLLSYYSGANTSDEDKLSLLLWAMYLDTKQKTEVFI